MTVPSQMVEHHPDDEEEEMFPMAERKLGEGRLLDLGREMDATAQELKED